MFNFLTKGITKLFGTKSDRDVKLLEPYVGLTNAEWQIVNTLTDEDLRGASAQLKDYIAQSLKTIDDQIDALRQGAESEANIDVKEHAFNQIDKLALERNVQLEVVLLEILPKAFAVVKETARRYAENGQIVVEATDFDRAYAAKNSNVTIEGNTATWHNSWQAGGATIVWDMVHYDVQIIGGVVLHQGKIAEMATGEGKTLVATLPAFLNALAGRGVHIVTVNDYLAKRDGEWMGPLFQFHKITVDCIDKHQPNTEERRLAYQADITYGTNNEFGFDYLRDNMANSVEELVQRKLHYAMVDEVDSVLVDDARTPLIISGPMMRGDEQEFEMLKPRISSLVEAQRAVVNKFLQDAKRKIAEGDDKEGGMHLFRAHRGLPKNKPLIKYLSEVGNKAILQKTENFYLADNQKNMPEADRPLYFTIDERNNNIDLTELGIDFITGQGEDPHFFILPDLSIDLDNIEKDKSISEDDRLAQKDALISDYSEKTRRIHTIQQLLKAYTLFEKDVEYIIVDGKVKIVDEQTGRVMEGRRYSDGLHQAIEAKENVTIEDATQTYATVTLQNYFRMYHKLAGMTGTAETEAGEFWSIYKLDVVTIPTNKVISRADTQDKVYKTTREKFNGVAEEIANLTAKGRPVLVGTTSVEISELLSKMLRLRGIKHNVLNAKQHQREAEIVGQAGQPSTVTIATNMAGRGTDIKLTPDSRNAGGLAIIGTERHESRRVDRQLRGRSGRQGDPGTSQFFVALDDNLMRLFGSDRIIKLMDRMGLEEGEVIQHSMVTSSIERAQKKVEESNFGMRKRLLEYDDVMNSQREIIYKKRRNALFGDRIGLDIMNMIFQNCETLINAAKSDNNLETLKLQTLHNFGHAAQSISAADLAKGKVDVLTNTLFDEIYAWYNHRNQQIAADALPIFKDIKATQGPNVSNVVVPFTDGKRFIQIGVDLDTTLAANAENLSAGVQKYAVLNFIDQAWKEHLRDMDDLKQSVQNAVFEQKDPLLVYKFESFSLFKAFMDKVNQEVLTFLFKAEIPVNEEPAPERQQPTQQRQVDNRRSASNTNQQGGYTSTSTSGGNYGYSSSDTPEDTEDVATAPAPKQQPMRMAPAIGRNDKVTVRYTNGELKEGVKYKSVEEDLAAGRCILIS